MSVVTSLSRPLYRLRGRLHQVVNEIDRHALIGQAVTAETLSRWLTLLDDAQRAAQVCVDAVDDAIDAAEVTA